MPSSKRLSFLTLAITAFSLFPPVGAGEVHVSPQGTDPGADGTAEKPFRSIARALESVSDLEGPVVLEVAGGLYETLSGEKFPISLKPSGPLTIRGPEEGAAILRGANEDALLEVTVAAGKCPSFRLERLHLEGGLSGITVVGERGAVFEAALVGNRFTGQRYQGLEVVAGSEGSAKAVVQGNHIDGGSAFAIDLGTNRKGKLEVIVEDNRIEDRSGSLPVPGSGSEPPRFGASIYMDLESEVRGRIDRNVFLNVPVGILLEEEEFEGVPGLLDLSISNCLIAGDPAPELNRLRHGFFFGIRPRATTNLRIEHNTVVNAKGYGLYQEEPADFTVQQEVVLEVSGCIFSELAQGEFSAESGGRTLLGYFRVHHNLLPAGSRRTGDGNLASDPVFEAGYRPSPGSPALDAGERTSGPWEGDAEGGCRVADGDGDGIYRIDLGALERAGPCERDARTFVRGDCDGSSQIEITDPVRLLGFMFLSALSPTCLDSYDSNDDGELNISDVIFALYFLFLAGEEPSPPYPAAGADPTPDFLGPCR